MAQVVLVTPSRRTPASSSFLGGGGGRSGTVGGRFPDASFGFYQYLREGFQN